jgi:hypothetical protein
MGWRSSNLKLKNSWAIQMGLGTNFFSREINLDFLCLNIYGPYSDMKVFWDHTLNLSLIKSGLVILGGDLNFTWGACEVWGANNKYGSSCKVFYTQIGDGRY